MKRAKIKNKYKLLLSSNNEIKNFKKEKNIKNTTNSDKINIYNLFKFIGMVLLFLFWTSIPILILGIDYNSFSYMDKIIYLSICDVLFLIFLFWRNRKDLKRDFKEFFSKNIKYYLLFSFQWWLVGLLVMYTSNYILYYITNISTATNEEYVREMITKAPLYMAFQISFYAPFTEEIIFRKSCFNIFKNKKIYVLFSGFVFGFMHIISSISKGIEVLYIIPYAALGIAFAYLYKKTNNIFCSMTMHFFHNSLALITYFIGGV